MKYKYKSGLIVCLIIFVLSTASACSKPAYLDGQLTDNAESVLDKDVDDEFSFIKHGNYRYATSENGLFYIPAGSNNIFYYNYLDGSSMIWCNKISCEHNDKSCIAYVAEEFELEYVEYYNGYVYKLDSDNNGVYLVRFNEDGTGEVRMANLIEGYSTGVSVDYGRVYAGKMYYIVRGKSEGININCVDLMNSNSVSTVFGIDYMDYKLSATSIFINDNNIYLSVLGLDDNAQSYSRKILCYDRKKQELGQLDSSHSIVSSCANDSLYYFTSDKSLYCISDGKEEEVHPGLFDKLPSTDYSINCNENYIVFMPSGEIAFSGGNSDIYVYNIKNDELNCIQESSVQNSVPDKEPEGVEIKTHSASSSKKFMFLQGISGRYVFVTGNANSEIYVIDLSTLEAKAISVDIIKQDNYK